MEKIYELTYADICDEDDKGTVVVTKDNIIGIITDLIADENVITYIQEV